MKKRLFHLTAALLLLLLCACGSKDTLPSYDKDSLSPYDEVNTIDGVWLEADNVTPTSADISFYNTDGRGDLFYGNPYDIERRSGDSWQPLEYINEGIDFTMEAIMLLPSDSPDGLTDVRSYDWELYYGPLEPGEYRFITSMMSHDDLPRTDYSPVYYLSAEFTISA